jgi:hypothetical protein
MDPFGGFWRQLIKLLFVFSLCERKNEQQKKIKYRSAEGKLRLSASPNNEGIR